MMPPLPPHPRPATTRRLFLRHAAAGVSGYTLLTSGGLLFETLARASTPAPPAPARQVIFIMLAGAPSHVDTFDFKEGPWTPRSFAPETYGDLRFPRGLMPALADQLRHLAFLRSVRSWAVVHGLSNQWIQIARNPVPSSARVAPHIGSVISHEFGGSGGDLPPFFALQASGPALTGGPGAGFLEPATSPVYLQPSANSALSPETPFMDRAAYQRRRALLSRLQPDDDNKSDAAALFAASARNMIFNSEVDALFRLDEQDAMRYGSSPFGNACQLARNLVQARRGVRYVEITFPGWDNHGGIYQSMPQLAKQLDEGLAALLQDLEASGTLAETLIVAMGEFGRTPGLLNAAGGRDHYPQMSVLMAGAGIQGSRAIGSTDPQGAATLDPGWSARRDMRPEDIAATIYYALGIDWTTVVRAVNGIAQRYEYVPFVEASPYRPITELWTPA